MNLQLSQKDKFQKRKQSQNKQCYLGATPLNSKRGQIYPLRIPHYKQLPLKTQLAILEDNFRLSSNNASIPGALNTAHAV